MRTKSFFAFPMALFISLFVFNCNNANRDDTTMDEQFQEEKLEVRQNLEEARADLDARIQKTEEELTDLKDQMANNMENANDELKAQWQEMENNLEKRKEELNKEKEELSDRISDIANATRENWEDFKMDAREWVDDINN